MIEAIIMICSILSLDPVIADCDNQWQLVFYDQPIIDTPYGIQAFGYAWYENQREYGIEPFWANGNPINAGMSNRTHAVEDGDPIVWHEIRHLVCECTWHE